MPSPMLTRLFFNSSTAMAMPLTYSTMSGRRSVDVSKGAALAEFDLAAGESATFILEDASYGEDSISAHPGYVSAAFKETSDYWRRWVRRSTYRGRWREIVNRSALVLKLLTSSEH